MDVDFISKVVFLSCFVFLIFCEFISFLSGLLFKKLHPSSCPICHKDLESTEVCFCCPFVVVHEWLECEDCCCQVPLSCHCGLKDKDYLNAVQNSRKEGCVRGEKNLSCRP